MPSRVERPLRHSSTVARCARRPNASMFILTSMTIPGRVRRADQGVTNRQRSRRSGHWPMASLRERDRVERLVARAVEQGHESSLVVEGRALPRVERSMSQRSSRFPMITRSCTESASVRSHRCVVWLISTRPFDWRTIQNSDSARTSTPKCSKKPSGRPSDRVGDRVGEHSAERQRCGTVRWPQTHWFRS